MKPQEEFDPILSHGGKCLGNVPVVAANMGSGGTCPLKYSTTAFGEHARVIVTAFVSAVYLVGGASFERDGDYEI